MCHHDFLLAQAKAFGEIVGKINGLTNNFNNLNADFASFSHYQQGNIALIGSDFKGAYSNYILSVKHSINSDNLQNVSRALKVLKQDVVPRLCKEDIEMLKKDTTMDIEDMFKHVALIDKKGVFVLDIKDLKMAINRLPDTNNN